MKKYVPIPGVKPQMLTDNGSLNGLLKGNFRCDHLVQTTGTNMKVLEIGKKNKIIYFVCEHPRNLEDGIIATSFDGSYIGLPLNTFRPEYQKQILEQVRERYDRR